MAGIVALIALIGLALTHERARKLAAKKWRPAIAIPIAVVVHYVMVGVLLVALWSGFGIPTGRFQLRVIDVAAGFDARGKLEPGDVLVAVDGVVVDGSIADRVNAAGGRAIRLTIERAGARREATVQPTQDEKGRWLLGIKPRLEPVLDHTTGSAMKLACVWPADSAVAFVRDARELLAGSDEPVMAGPIRIVEEVVTPFAIGQVVVALLLRFALLALLVQTVIDVIRARRG